VAEVHARFRVLRVPPFDVMTVGAKSEHSIWQWKRDPALREAAAKKACAGHGDLRFDGIVPGNPDVSLIQSACGNPAARLLWWHRLNVGLAVMEILAVSPKWIGDFDLAKCAERQLPKASPLIGMRMRHFLNGFVEHAVSAAVWSSVWHGACCLRGVIVGRAERCGARGGIGRRRGCWAAAPR